MTWTKDWTRRQFVAGTSAAATLAASGLQTHAEGQRPQSVMPPPGVITGGIQPLLTGTTARPMRYRAEGAEFVIVNGAELFNRPLYGPNIAFRVDAGDQPEFSLYLPGHGGNLRLGLATGAGRKWLGQARRVTARYRPGRMIYEIEDELLGGGGLRIELLTAGAGAGLMLRAEAHGVAAPVALSWAFGGASGRKGRRNGDIGCENEPVAHFFAVRPEECARNEYTLEAPQSGSSVMARLRSPFCALAFEFPAGSWLRVADFAAWTEPVRAEKSCSERGVERPILTGWVDLANDSAVYIGLLRTDKDAAQVAEKMIAERFAERSRKVEEIAATLQAQTPDATLDAACAALGVAADGIWDEAQECVMHGGVAWRVPLPGWRGPYALDALGWHERARLHFRHWLAKQNQAAVTTADPATGPFDAGSRFSRKETLLHSNGDIAQNHYDMNLVFFDALLRHLRWTGDVEFAREAWPALKRHLAWERRLFRRVYRTQDGRELPLYEAYAAIWASDNLQYNGGGAAHATAYVLFAQREAARLARVLGEDPAPYEQEARLIEEGLRALLWVREQGALAESKDILGAQTVYNNPALWTVYHAIDSEAVSPVEGWQMMAERLSALRRIPVEGAGVGAENAYLLSCSDWLPYLWSLNLLAMAENQHLALAMWQTGMAEEAYGLLKGNLLDSMQQGLTPGNFHMSSQLDVHRQEAQRDFGDPVGITARALVEGLFGVEPDLMDGVVRLRPQFPQGWDHASVRHREFDLTWKRAKSLETLEFASRFARPVALEVRLRARGTARPRVRVNGAAAEVAFDPRAIGAPQVVVKAAAAKVWRIEVEWRGEQPLQMPAVKEIKLGERLTTGLGGALLRLDDPQEALDGRGAARREGFHTTFAQMRVGECCWQLPVSFAVRRRILEPLPKLEGLPQKKFETIDLNGVLKNHLQAILTRGAIEPRSPYCSLALPEQLLGGWANNNFSAEIDDRGLRAENGILKTDLGVPFRVARGEEANCLFLSQWKPDAARVEIPLSGRAEAIYLLVAGTTYPQASHMRHGAITVRYTDGSREELPLVNPETWWPINEDYLLDDYLYLDAAELPARVDLVTGKTRILDRMSFKGKGREVKDGAATILGLRLDGKKELATMHMQCELYGVVLSLIGATLVRKL